MTRCPFLVFQNPDCSWICSSSEQHEASLQQQSCSKAVRSKAWLGTTLHQGIKTTSLAFNETSWIRRFWIQAVWVHKATSCHRVLPPQLPKSLSQSKECKLPGDFTTKWCNLLLHRPQGWPSADTREENPESTSMAECVTSPEYILFTGERSFYPHPPKFTVHSPSEVTPCVTSTIQESIPSGICRQKVYFSPNSKSLKKIQRTAFGSKEAFEMWKNLECRTQVDGEVISPWPNK